MKLTTLTYAALLLVASLATGDARALALPTGSLHDDDRPAALPSDQDQLPAGGDRDSTGNASSKETPPPRMFMWHLDRMPGMRVNMEVDTVPVNFHSSNLMEDAAGHFQHLGNLGSPRLTRIYSERIIPEATTFFIGSYDNFLVRPEQLKFTNSNIPYTNLTYYKTGDKVNGQERFKAYFSINANKRTAFGFNVDYLYGRGYFTNQNTAHFLGQLFGSYIGDHYEMHAILSSAYMKMNENGGITDDQYITNPENMTEGKKSYEPSSIPVNMEEANNRNHNFFVYYNHRYNVGFTRRTMQVTEHKSEEQTPDALGEPSNRLGLPEGPGAKGERPDMPEGRPGSPNGGPEGPGGKPGDPNDSPEGTDEQQAKLDTTYVEEFVPVTSFLHTIKIERSRHTYRDQDETIEYDNTYYEDGESCDSTIALSIRNMVGISLLEGFNKYAKAGLTVYLLHEFNRFDLMGDTLGAVRHRINEQELWIGGELSKKQGHTLHYTLSGELGLLDKAAGQFRARANIDLNFPLGRDTVVFEARGHLTNTLAPFYFRHYRSNHFAWDSDLSKELHIRAEGELSIKRWGTRLRVGVENIKNYTYLSSQATPVQHSGNIQLIDATLKQDFHLGVLHLDNEITWQQTSEESILPLPKLSLYHNLYLLGKLAHRVLTVQLGADLRYFTSYYAPTYTPALQHYNLQNEDDRVEIGGYPVINVYANIHLKRTRIFVMMYHVNAGMGSRQYFYTPHYPLDGRLFKFGISWNFYD